MGGIRLVNYEIPSPLCPIKSVVDRNWHATKKCKVSHFSNAKNQKGFIWLKPFSLDIPILNILFDHMLIVLSVSRCLVINFDVLNKQRITIWKFAINAFTADIEKQVDKFRNVFRQLHDQYQNLMYIFSQFIYIYPKYPK